MPPTTTGSRRSTTPPCSDTPTSWRCCCRLTLTSLRQTWAGSAHCTSPARCRCASNQALPWTPCHFRRRRHAPSVRAQSSPLVRRVPTVAEGTARGCSCSLGKRCKPRRARLHRPHATRVGEGQGPPPRAGSGPRVADDQKGNLNGGEGGIGGGPEDTRLEHLHCRRMWCELRSYSNLAGEAEGCTARSGLPNGQSVPRSAWRCPQWAVHRAERW